MVLIEKYSKTIETSYVKGLSVYTDYNNSIIAEKEQFMVFYAYLFFALVGGYYFLFFLRLTEKIIVNLENKIKILKIFNIGNPAYPDDHRNSLLN